MQARQLSLSVIEQHCVCLSDTCSICRYSAVAPFTWTRRAYRSCSSPTIRYNSFFSTIYLILYPVNPVSEYVGCHRSIMRVSGDAMIGACIMHVQERPKGMLKTDKRDALTLANHLYNQLEKGIQAADKTQLVRRAVPPSGPAAHRKA